MYIPGPQERFLLNSTYSLDNASTSQVIVGLARVTRAGYVPIFIPCVRVTKKQYKSLNFSYINWAQFISIANGEDVINYFNGTEEGDSIPTNFGPWSFTLPSSTRRRRLIVRTRIDHGSHFPRNTREFRLRKNEWIRLMTNVVHCVTAKLEYLDSIKACTYWVEKAFRKVLLEKTITLNGAPIPLTDSDFFNVFKSLSHADFHKVFEEVHSCESFQSHGNGKMMTYIELKTLCTELFFLQKKVVLEILNQELIDYSQQHSNSADLETAVTGEPADV